VVRFHNAPATLSIFNVKAPAARVMPTDGLRCMISRGAFDSGFVGLPSLAEDFQLAMQLADGLIQVLQAFCFHSDVQIFQVE
jgi:hypothetical protein